MLIYSAAVEAKFNALLQHTHTHTPLMAYINPHVISRSPRAPTCKGGCAAHCRPALDRITSDAIYYHTDFYLLSHSPLSFSPSPRACTDAELYSNQITLHIIKKEKLEKQENMVLGGKKKNICWLGVEACWRFKRPGDHSSS